MSRSVRARPPRVAAARAGRSGLLSALPGLALAAGAAAAADPFGELALIRPGPPRPAPELSIPGLDGEALRLAAFRGQVVLLNFWAAWCPPCREEMPSMERLYRRHRERGFTIVAVSLDTGGEAVVATFVKRLGLTFPIGLDAKLEVADRYAIRALPSSLLIDRAGRTVAVAIGPRDWDSPAAHAVIEAMLGEAAGAASTGPAARIAVFGIAQSVVICHDI